MAEYSSISSADTLAAHAFGKALDAERAAQEAIAECERESARRLEHARNLRRSILERAHARIVAIHARMAKVLEARCERISESRRREASLAEGRLADPARRAAALQVLAAYLTSDDADP